jgi:hypothetical protein
VSSTVATRALACREAAPIDVNRCGASLDDAAILENVLDLKEVDARIVAVQTAETAAAVRE